jgi:hypothetical protein
MPAASGRRPAQPCKPPSPAQEPLHPLPLQCPRPLAHPQLAGLIHGFCMQPPPPQIRMALNPLLHPPPQASSSQAVAARDHMLAPPPSGVRAPIEASALKQTAVTPDPATTVHVSPKNVTPHIPITTDSQNQGDAGRLQSQVAGSLMTEARRSNHPTHRYAGLVAFAAAWKKVKP